MRFGPHLQYFCSRCGNVLKKNTTLVIQNQQLKEECPSCGALLIDTLQNKIKLSQSVSEQQQVTTNITHKPTEHLSVEFQTAYQQIKDSSSNSINKFPFDINKIDSLLNLNARGSLCIIGEQKYTQLLIDRLCVHSLLPKRHGGIGGPDYSKIIAIDAGNCTDVYQCIDFARQYGLEVKKVLQSIVVSRVFTIYQLAHLIIFELPKIIEQFSSRNKIIVIYGLLHLFVSDSHIDKADAKQLIKEIAGSLWKFSKDSFVVASFTYSNSEYEKQFVPVFDKCIKVTNDINDNRILQMNVSNHNTKKKDSLRKAALRLKKRELLLVS